MTYDAIIKGGRWFDGTGAALRRPQPRRPRRPGRGRHRRRARRDRLPRGGRRRRAVGDPGLVDIHTHYDIEVLDGPGLPESVRHGVTTLLLGSCSLSTVHVGGVDAGDLFGRVEAIPRQHVIRAVDEHQDLEHRRASTSTRSSRSRSAPTSRRSSATPTCAPRRWAWTAPPARRCGRPAASRRGWRRCSTRRSTPASSACRPSSCSSTSSTATCAARAPCPRRTPRARRCAACARSCAAARRALQAGPDASHPHTIVTQALGSIGWFGKPALRTSLLSAADIKAIPFVIHLMRPLARGRQPARRRLPLAAPAGAVRGVRRRHRPGDLRGVRLRRDGAAPAGEAGARRADARPGVPREVPQGLREQVRPAGLAPRLLRRRDRRLPRRVGGRQVVRPGRRRARRQAPGRRVPRPGRSSTAPTSAGARRSATTGPSVLQKLAQRPRHPDRLLRRRRPPAQHGLLQLRAAAAQARPRRRAGRQAVHDDRARRAPADRRARRVVPHRRRPPCASATAPTWSCIDPDAPRRRAGGVRREPGRAVRRPVPDGQPQRRRRPGRVRRRPPGGRRRRADRRCSAPSAPASSCAPSEPGAPVRRPPTPQRAEAAS